MQARAPGAALIGAGGIRDAADLERAEAAGATAWLVASALHDGRLPAAAPVATEPPRQRPVTDLPMPDCDITIRATAIGPSSRSARRAGSAWKRHTVWHFWGTGASAQQRAHGAAVAHRLREVMPMTDAPLHGVVAAANWTCPFCPLLCDRWSVRGDAAGGLELMGSDCARARAGWRSPALQPALRKR